LARLSYASSSQCGTSLRGRENLPVGSSISSSAGAPAIRDEATSPSRVDVLNARSLAEEPIVRLILDGTAVALRPRLVACTLAGLTVIAEEIPG
jgi:hypothetical protein